MLKEMGKDLSFSKKEERLDLVFKRDQCVSTVGILRKSTISVKAKDSNFKWKLTN
jgi:hypothetical protein